MIVNKPSYQKILKRMVWRYFHLVNPQFQNEKTVGPP